jgi:hypothetical protein
MDEPKSADVKAGFRDNNYAPIVYFDATSAHGVLNGTIQIELVARILVRRDDDSAGFEFLTTGRLRCSPTAANHLRDALGKALEMLSLPRPATSEANLPVGNKNPGQFVHPDRGP